MVLVHQDKEYLRFIIPKLKKYLRENIDLELHPNKVYLQHFSKGVNFLGVIIKPYRVYIRNRIKGNFYKKIKAWNNYLKEKENKLSKEEARKFLSCVNSYLGLMKHYKTRKIRRKMLAKNLSVYFWNYVYPAPFGQYLRIKSKATLRQGAYSLPKRCGVYIEGDYGKLVLRG